MKEQCVTLDLDNTSLMAALDEIGPHIQGLPTKEICKFIRSAFYLGDGPTLRTGDAKVIVWKPTKRFADLLPALLAGDLSFGALKDILESEIGIGNESSHT